jgi:hypothetical protein
MLKAKDVVSLVNRRFGGPGRAPLSERGGSSIAGLDAAEKPGGSRVRCGFAVLSAYGAIPNHSEHFQPWGLQTPTVGLKACRLPRCLGRQTLALFWLRRP